MHISSLFCQKVLSLTRFLSAFLFLNENSLFCDIGPVNGIPGHANKRYVDILRKEKGFDGVIVTDYQEVYHLLYIHHYVPDLRTV
jgi:hypothetical protein